MRTAKLDQLDGLHTGRSDPGLSGTPNVVAKPPVFLRFLYMAIGSGGSELVGRDTTRTIGEVEEQVG